MSSLKYPPNHLETLRQSSPSHASPAALPGGQVASISGSATVRSGGLNRSGFLGGSIVLGTPAKGCTGKKDTDILDDVSLEQGDIRSKKKRKKNADDDDEKSSRLGTPFTREIEIRIFLVLICIGVVILGLLNYVYNVRQEADKTNKNFAPSSKITHRELF